MPVKRFFLVLGTASTILSCKKADTAGGSAVGGAGAGGPTPNDDTGPTASAMALSAQAAVYKYVVNSFIQNVPAAQRYGFTVWGGRQRCWVNTSQKKTDAPLLFDNNYGRKPAFYSLWLGSKSK
ncbi:MAG: endo-1,4-beta-xylanase [Chitinophagaceae bacterium]|nr:endo-1,4-beta-xylanase [Chitinophagaceae bacterium]